MSKRFKQQVKQLRKTSQLVSTNEQSKISNQTKENVRKFGFLMRRALDQGKIPAALKNASQMLDGLRTSALSPKNYYDLYMQVSDELRYLEFFLQEDIKSGKSASKLYKEVQFVEAIVPRLYLMVTTGSVLIKSQEVETQDVLSDLIEMCKGVQHPTRGLFLRHYLSQMTKDKLPDKGSEYATSNDQESLSKSIDFTIKNFIEMNKLWVRIAHQKTPGNLTKKEKEVAQKNLDIERKELKILVGTNLVRLSQLEIVNLEVYTERVLPLLLQQINECGDPIAQEYLMEVIIQVFSDDYHISTLPSLLQTISKLAEGVNIKQIMISLINRLIKYSESNVEDIRDKEQIFTIFSKGIGLITKERKNMPVKDLLSILNSLIQLALQLNPKQIDYIDRVLRFCYNSASESGSLSRDIIKEINNLLTTPLTKYNNVNILLEFENYSPLIELLPYNDRRRIALKIIENVLQNSTYIKTSDKVKKLLEYVKILVQDEKDMPSESEEDEYQKTLFLAEQDAVCRLVHLLKSKDHIESFKIVQVLAQKFGNSGERRIKHTVSPLVFSSLLLSFKIRDYIEDNEEEQYPLSPKKVFEFVYKIVTSLTPLFPLISLKLLLQCAQASDKCGFEAISYEFMTKSILAYEEHVVVSKVRFEMITLISSTLQTLRVFDEENYSTLANHAGGHSSKLMVVNDQARAVYMCSYLFWIEDDEEDDDSEDDEEEDEDKEKIYFKDTKRLQGCISRAIRVAGSLMESASMFQLLFEILNVCLYFLRYDIEQINTDYINTLLELIHRKIEENNTDLSELVEPQMFNFYKSTIKHIKYCQSQDETEDLFKEINISISLKDLK
ncbi:vacuolar sorting protein [Anaeramoeba flamelloides]|uniref:Vacuolar protein sorting-associated protein 35 n=1 Tax=Anaeramoeba flamelloides TaxID=1746091 RepID=A0ABQ8YHI5_9EUKA|nr:vacuolar sorting protein [Anaeramoeba flamelloides]